MISKDYYRILGLTRNASPDQIRQRFRELAFENHPDISRTEDSVESFIEIYEAYHILSQPNQKNVYDKLYDNQGCHAVKTETYEAKSRNDLWNVSAEARKKAQQKAKVKYNDFIRDLDCFFIPGLKADGTPFSYPMHRNTGIAGATGPMGTIKSQIINIPIPRSSLAYSLHKTGLIIKTVSFFLAIILFYLDPFSADKTIIRISVSSLTILTGGIITMIFYRLVNVKSKFFHAKRFPLVEKYRSKGYTRGFHPVVSTTPAGIIAWLLRLFF
jgi:hypothetical protein